MPPNVAEIINCNKSPNLMPLKMHISFKASCISDISSYSHVSWLLTASIIMLIISPNGINDNVGHPMDS